MNEMFRWLSEVVLAFALVLLPARPCAAQCSPTLPPGVIAVDLNSTASTPDGRSWACAFNDLAEALDYARVSLNGVTEVWVRAGTYTPGMSSSDTFLLEDDIDVYGGFAGTETISHFQADPDANPTILSGNLGSSTFATNVVTALDTTANLTRLDGFTITNGFGGPGAGLHIAIDQIVTGTVRLNVTRCKFVSNFALSSNGGAVALMDHAGGHTPEIVVFFTNCRFENNSAVDGGAVYFDQNAHATFSNCVFAANSASGRGGAIYLQRTCAALIDCEETGPCQGGLGNQANINSCTFWGNTADIHGGGIWLGRDEGMLATGCIFWENSTEDDEDTTEEEQIATEFGCEVDKDTVHYSCVQGLSALGGIQNISSDPLFVNAGAGYFQLRGSSPAIDEGNIGIDFPDDELNFDYDMSTTGVGGELAPDLDRHNRIIGAGVDMGAYEHLCGCEADSVNNLNFGPPPDGIVDAADLAFLLGAWGNSVVSAADTVTSLTFAPPPDGNVDAADLAWLLGTWGTCTDECDEEEFGEGSGAPYDNTEIGDLLDQLLLEEDEEDAALLITELLEMLTD